MKFVVNPCESDYQVLSLIGNIAANSLHLAISVHTWNDLMLRIHLERGTTVSLDRYVLHNKRRYHHPSKFSRREIEHRKQD